MTTTQNQDEKFWYGPYGVRVPWNITEVVSEDGLNIIYRDKYEINNTENNSSLTKEEWFKKYAEIKNGIWWYCDERTKSIKKLKYENNNNNNTNTNTSIISRYYDSNTKQLTLDLRFAKENNETKLLNVFHTIGSIESLFICDLPYHLLKYPAKILRHLKQRGELKSIKLLNFFGYYTGDFSIMEIIESNPKLIDIDFYGGTVELELLYNAIQKSNITLKNLKICGCRLGDEDSNMICNIIQYCSNLEDFDISRNEFSDEGMVPIIKNFKNLPLLKKLSIGCINLGFESAMILSEYLSVNRKSVV